MKTIAEYKAARAKIEDEWAKLCERNDWPPTVDNSKEFNEFAQQEIAKTQKIYELSQEHLRPSADATNSAFELWLYVTLVQLPLVEMFRSNQPNYRSQNACINEIFGSLLRLGVAWADSPPYPELTSREVVDTLASIAMRLEQDEAKLRGDGKSPPKRIRRTKEEWNSIYEEYQAELHDDPDLTPAQFAKSKDIERTGLLKNFGRIKKQNQKEAAKRRR
jgi:hypothetical protein